MELKIPTFTGPRAGHWSAYGNSAVLLFAMKWLSLTAQSFTLIICSELKTIAMWAPCYSGLIYNSQNLMSS